MFYYDNNTTLNMCISISNCVPARVLNIQQLKYFFQFIIKQYPHKKNNQQSVIILIQKPTNKFVEDRIKIFYITLFQGNIYSLITNNKKFILILLKMKSRTKKNIQTPLFIQKLIQMLEDQQANSVISWTNDGENFAIKSVSAFTETTLPRYFKHRNYSSFIRQLNMYGFSKTRHQQGENVYTNENFKRKNKNLLKNIKRKINIQKEDRIIPYNGISEPVTKQIQALRVKQKDLETVCRHLVTQNQKLLMENNNLMKKMKQQSRQKDKKLEQLLLSLIMVQNNNAVTNQENPSKGNAYMLTSNINGQDLNSSRNQNQSLFKQASQQGYQKLLEEQKNVENFNKLLNFIYSGNGKSKYQLQNDALINGINQQKKDYLSQRAIDKILHTQNIEPIEPIIQNNPKQDSFLSINDFLNIDSGVGNDLL